MGKWEKLNDSNPEIRRNVIRRMVQFPAAWIFIASLLFNSAGTMRWAGAWLFMAVLVSVDLIGVLFIPLEVLAERGSKKENVEDWDKLLAKFIVVSMMSTFLIAGLDHRWHWSPDMVPGLQRVSIAVFILGCALEIWAMSANWFFSDVVRIQYERGQTVCSGGPYKYIRHPGYLGMIMYYFATPIFLGSFWAMVPAFATMTLFVIRTKMEDKTLLQKLSGYKEYADRVRFRLIPGLW